MHRTKEDTDLTKMVNLWKQKKVESVTMNFSCGGDSMNDTDFEVHFEDGSEETEGELVDYFNDEVYNKVEFYVNSDGHYEGEAGTVEITLDEDDDDFSYEKNSRSQWNEGDNVDVFVKVSPKELAFLKEHVLNINGGGEEETAVNYKHDFILTPEMETLTEKLTQKISDAVSDARENVDVAELNDWYSFTTGESGDLEFKGKTLKVILNYSYTEWKDED